MAKRITKEDMYKDFSLVSTEFLYKVSELFELKEVDIFAQAFHVQQSNFFKDGEPIVTPHFQDTASWKKLSMLYDYAADGVIAESGMYEDIGDDVTELVIECDEILTLIQTMDYRVSEETRDILEAGDARFALDEGGNLTTLQIALLANVDERTVRNAVSAGELKVNKDAGQAYVINKSARLWLSNRRGFKETQLKQQISSDFSDITSPAELGAFLQVKREDRGFETIGNKINGDYPNIDLQILRELESGIFIHGLDVITPIADFYQLDRNEFLMKIMMIFFKNQLLSIKEYEMTKH